VLEVADAVPAERSVVLDAGNPVGRATYGRGL